MIYIFRDDVRVYRKEDNIYILGNNVMLLKYTSIMEKFICNLRKGIDSDELEKILGLKMLNKFINNGVIVSQWENEFKNTIVEKQIYYLEQFHKDPNELQKKISNSSVAIIGLGGAGGVILENLVRSGLKNIILIDFDKVNIDNLNRQTMYTSNSIGKNKVSECIEYIKLINKKCNIKSYNKYINRMEDLYILDKDTIDIIINAADTPDNISNIVFQYARRRKIAFMTCSIALNQGTWGPLFTAKSYLKQINMLLCPCKEYEVLDGKDEPLRASTCFTNNIISSIVAMEVIKYLIDEVPNSLEKKIKLDLNDFSIIKKSF